MKKFTAAEALSLIPKLKLKRFDKRDWEAFAGVQSSEPWICYHKNYTFVVDDDRFDIYANDMTGDFQSFQLSERRPGT
jgi:hypothetical protein